MNGPAPRRLLVPLMLSIVAGSGTLRAQDPSAEIVDDLRTMMSAMRSGQWDVAWAETVVKGLLDARRISPAGWWMEFTQDALKAGKITGKDAGTRVRQLRSRYRLMARAQGEDRQLLDRALKHLEACVRAKNYAQGRRLLCIASLLVAEFPDTTGESVIKRQTRNLGKHADAPDTNRAKLDAQEQETRKLFELANEVMRARIDAQLVDFEVCGCAPGRLALRDRILAFYGDPETPSANERLNRLLTLARKLEPTKTLELWILGDPSFMKVYREEGLYAVPGVGSKFSVNEMTPLRVEVFSGDVIRFVPTGGLEFSERKHPTGHHVNSVLLILARLDGQRLSPRQWTSVSRPEMTEAAPRHHPVLVGKKVSWDANLAVEGKREKHMITFAEGGKRFAHGHSERTRYMEMQFEEARLPFDWLTGTAEKSSYFLRIP